MLIGCCLLQGGSLGIVHNCRGIFYAPVIEDLGFGMGAFTFTCSFSASVRVLFCRLSERSSAASIRAFCSAARRSCFPARCSPWAFSGRFPPFTLPEPFRALPGAFLMFYPAPYILGNWFHKKRGLAVGLAAAFSGIVGGSAIRSAMPSSAPSAGASAFSRSALFLF